MYEILSKSPFKGSIVFPNGTPKGMKAINLNGEPVAIVFGKTEHDVDNFAQRIAGLLEASTGLHYEIAIKLMRAAKKKWQALNQNEDPQFVDADSKDFRLREDSEVLRKGEPTEPEQNPDE